VHCATLLDLQHIGTKYTYMYIIDVYMYYYCTLCRTLYEAPLACEVDAKGGGLAHCRGRAARQQSAWALAR
jgi:hypothetical protein